MPTYVDPRESTVVVMSALRERRQALTSDQCRRPIPYVVCMTSPVLALPWRFAMQIEALIQREPCYTFHFFDDGACRDYILEHAAELPIGTLEAFDNLIPGAFKSDLFRYVFAYIEGGIYVDVNKKVTAPLDAFAQDNLDLVLVKDQTSYCFPWHFENEKIWQAYMACRPGLPLMHACIEKVIYNSKHHVYGQTFLEPTGPFMMGEVLRDVYHLDKVPEGGRFLWQGDRVRIFYPFNLFDHQVTDEETGQDLLHLKSGEDEAIINAFFANTSKTKRYAQAWRDRHIYYDEDSEHLRAYQRRKSTSLMVIVLLLVLFSIFVWVAPRESCCTRRMLKRCFTKNPPTQGKKPASLLSSKR